MAYRAHETARPARRPGPLERFWHVYADIHSVHSVSHSSAQQRNEEPWGRLRTRVVNLRRAPAPVPHLSVSQGGSMWARQTALSSGGFQR
eukprot:5673465-Pyramimonas_sp.AAC.1